MVTPITATVPDPAAPRTKPTASAFERASNTWTSKPGTPLEDINIDRVFIGSCTNGRIEDLRAAATIVKGHNVATHVRAMVVPGSQAVKIRPKQKASTIFKEAGFDWREPGCSMCLGMNPDISQPGERCASTSNRNFEGRQGRGGRTHLVSPEMAAAAAITGHFTDIRNWKLNRNREAQTNGTLQDHHLARRAARSRQRRHRPDHPQAVPQAHRAHRLRRVPLLRLAPLQDGPNAAIRPQLRAQQPEVQGREDPHRRQELRLRQLAASTPPGRSATTASAPSSRPPSPTSSSPTPARTASSSSASEEKSLLLRTRRHHTQLQAHRLLEARPSPTTQGFHATFEIDPFRKYCLLKASTTSASPCATPPNSTPRSKARRRQLAQTPIRA
jgi:hypothetical protein